MLFRLQNKKIASNSILIIAICLMIMCLISTTQASALIWSQMWLLQDNEQETVEQMVPESQAESQQDELLITLDPTYQSEKKRAGQNLILRIPLTMNANQTAAEYEIVSLRIEPNISSDVRVWPIRIEAENLVRDFETIHPGERVEVVFNCSVSQRAEPGQYQLPFQITYTQIWLADGSEDNVSYMIEIPFEVLTYESNGSAQTGAIGVIQLLNQDELTSVQEFTVDNGSVTLSLTLHNSGKQLTDVKLMLEIPSDASELPVQLNENNIAYNLPDIAEGETFLLELEYQVDPDAETGVKPITFTVFYYEEGEAGESNITAYINIPATEENNEEAVIIERERIDLQENAFSEKESEPENTPDELDIVEMPPTPTDREELDDKDLVQVTASAVNALQEDNKEQNDTQHAETRPVSFANIMLIILGCILAAGIVATVIWLIKRRKK